MKRDISGYHKALWVVFGLALLWGCGGGGGGSSPSNTSSVQFTAVPSSQPANADLFYLALNTAESTSSLAVIDLMGSNLDTTDASGIAADLSINSGWMTLSGIEVDSQGADVAMAAVLETDADTIVIGIHGLKAQSGRLAKLRFQIGSTGRTAQLTFSNLKYITSGSSLLISPTMNGWGGTLQN